MPRVITNKVISKKSISFPALNWAITAGVETELPENEEARKRILEEHEIKLVDENITSNKSEEDKK